MTQLICENCWYTIHPLQLLNHYQTVLSLSFRNTIFHFPKYKLHYITEYTFLSKSSRSPWRFQLSLFAFLVGELLWKKNQDICQHSVTSWLWFVISHLTFMRLNHLKNEVKMSHYCVLYLVGQFSGTTVEMNVFQNNFEYKIQVFQILQ